MSFIFILFFNLAHSSETIYFNHSVESCVNKDLLWSDLENAFLDSTNSLIWPNTESEVTGEGLNNFSKIFVTYKLSFFSETYTYNLESVIQNQEFTYIADAENHPFSGGATISLTTSSTGTRLDWTGEYKTQNNQWLQRQVFKQYSKRFFKRLDSNFEALELLQGCRNL